MSEPADTPTETVPLPAGADVNWVPNRKVWVGASAATIATAAASVTVWVLQSSGVEVPLGIEGSIGILFGGLMAVAVYFVQAYWITEPPTLQPGERILRELIDDAIITQKTGEEILKKAAVRSNAPKGSKAGYHPSTPRGRK